MFTPAREAAQFADIPPDDGEVLGRILNALYWDLAVPSDYLSVKVEKGWVTMSGEVACPYQKSCAEADVRRVSGVRGVTNGIDVEATVSQAASVPPHLASIAATAQAAPR